MGITMGKKSKKVQYLALTCQIWEHYAWVGQQAASAASSAAPTNCKIIFSEPEIFQHFEELCQKT